MDDEKTALVELAGLSSESRSNVCDALTSAGYFCRVILKHPRALMPSEKNPVVQVHVPEEDITIETPND